MDTARAVTEVCMSLLPFNHCKSQQGTYRFNYNFSFFSPSLQATKVSEGQNEIDTGVPTDLPHSNPWLLSEIKLSECSKCSQQDNWVYRVMITDSGWADGGRSSF